MAQSISDAVKEALERIESREQGYPEEAISGTEMSELNGVKMPELEASPQSPALTLEVDRCEVYVVLGKRRNGRKVEEGVAGPIVVYAIDDTEPHRYGRALEGVIGQVLGKALAEHPGSQLAE